jgi:leucyl/phenylalanyl-tRNA--protein transferase
VDAYRHGIFPWFSSGEPILWWSTEPRMVLHTQEFKLHRSFLKTLKHFTSQPACEVRFDSDFARVIQACAGVSRTGQGGTWITPEMVQAYTELHRLGLAHSVETWIDGELVGGLYCVALGRAVFGESMFSLASDASKIALGALVAFCRAHHIELIDCQQQTPHLKSLGARPMARSAFLEVVQEAMQCTDTVWDFNPIYWQKIHPSLSLA